MGIDCSWLLGKTCVGSFGVSEVMIAQDIYIKALPILVCLFLVIIYFTFRLYSKNGQLTMVRSDLLESEGDCHLSIFLYMLLD